MSLIEPVNPFGDARTDPLTPDCFACGHRIKGDQWRGFQMGYGPTLKIHVSCLSNTPFLRLCAAYKAFTDEIAARARSGKPLHE